MAYRKYIKRGNKRYGPYLYENKRVGNRVITSYAGKPPKENNFLVTAILGLLILGVFSFVIFNERFIDNKITGNVALRVAPVYREGATVTGSIDLIIAPGECIPEDSTIVAVYNKQKNFALSGLIGDGSLTEGTYYAIGANLPNTDALCYGLLGEKPVAINFELLIFDSEDEVKDNEEVEESEDVKSEEPPDLGVENKSEEGEGEEGDEVGSAGEGEEGDSEGGGASVSDQAGSESADSGSDISKDSSTKTTGSAVSESEHKVNGNVKKGADFEYNLEEGKTAKVIEGSVKINGELADDGEVKIKISGKKVVVSTDYVEGCFGEECVTEGNALILKIPIENLEFTATESKEINVKLVYEEQILAEAGDKISVMSGIGIPPIVNKEGIIANDSNASVLVESTHSKVIVRSGVKSPHVDWKTDVKSDRATHLEVSLPSNAEDVRVTYLEAPLESDTEVKVKDDEGTKVTEAEEVVEYGEVPEVIEKARVEGFVTLALHINGNEKKEEPFFKKLFLKIKNLFGVTGKVIAPQDSGEILVDIPLANEAIVEYKTPAPIATEEVIANGIRMDVKSHGVDYKDVTFITELDNSIVKDRPHRVRVYEVKKDFRKEIRIDGINKNPDIDKYEVEFTSDLSDRTFDIIIITAAEHLNENREFISDIYDSVKELDNNWSEEIPDMHYVRTTFERNLTADRDITVYPRTVSGTPRIEVYEFNKTEVIAEFTSLNDNEYNKVLLDGSSGAGLGNRSQNTFDLRVVDGIIQLDHIIDPPAAEGQVNVTDCRPLNQTNKVYVLRNDVSTTGTCFTVTENNVTFEGEGFSIYYGNQSHTNEFYGILLNNINGSVIRNATISRGEKASTVNPRFAITVSSSPSTTIEDVNITYNSRGIYVLNSINTTISRNFIFNVTNTCTELCNANQDSAGVYISGSNNTIFEDSEIRNSGLGSADPSSSYYITLSSHGIIRDSVIDSSIRHALFLSNIRTSNTTVRNLNISNTNVSFYDIKWNTAGIDNTYLINMSHIENYTFTGAGGTLIFENSFGEIRFLEAVNGSGTNLTNDIRIANNSATVLSTSNIGLNKSANITLYGVATNFVTPVISRNGAECGNICYNFTSLNAGTVIFNVTYWTNYTISENATFPAYSAKSVTPASPVNYSNNTNYTFEITWTNTISIAILSFNGTNYTMTPGPADPETTPFSYIFAANSLAAGNYTYYYWANNTEGNSNQTSESNYTINKANPSGTLSNQTSLNITYDTPFNYTFSETNGGDGDLTYLVFRNGTDATFSDVTNQAGTNVTLAAGDYTYILNTTGGQNYTKNASMSTLVLKINKASSNVTTYVNHSRADIDAGPGSNIWLNVSLLNISLISPANNTVQLWLDSQLLYSGNDSGGNLTAFANEGIFTIKGNYSGNQNYTSGTESWTVSIIAGGTQINPSPSPSPSPSGGGGGGSSSRTTPPPASNETCEPVWAVGISECVDGERTITYNDQCGQVITQEADCNEIICDESFDCIEWSECVEGRQYRKCDETFIQVCGYAEEKECEVFLTPNFKISEILKKIGQLSEDITGLAKGKKIAIYIIVFLSLGVFVFVLHFVFEPRNRIERLIRSGESALKRGNVHKAVRNYATIKKVYPHLSTKEKVSFGRKYKGYYNSLQRHLKTK